MSEFERWVLVATAIGTVATIFKAFIQPWIKREKLTVTVTRFYIDDKKDSKGKRILGHKMAQLLLTFKNCGNQQAAITGFKFIYYDLEQYADASSEFFNENKEFCTPKVLVSGETYPYKYEEFIDIKKLRDSLTFTTVDQNLGIEKVKLGMRISVTNSKGELKAKTVEICILTNTKNALIYSNQIKNTEFDLFKNKHKRLRIKNKGLYTDTDPLF